MRRWIAPALVAGTLVPNLLFGALINVAPIGTATQSSDFGAGQFPASLGIDGNTGNFTHTAAGDTPATWQVDLGVALPIEEIILHNRDNCCGTRLRDITVQILDAAEAVQWESDLLNPENADGAPETIPLDIVALNGSAVTGSIVRVIRTPDPDFSGNPGVENGDESDVLSLGEVEVFADSASLPLTITSQPQGRRVYVGTCEVSFNVGVADTADVTYQWRKDGMDLAGETGASLTIENVQPDDAGTYDVVVTRNAEEVTSDGAVLDVPGRNLAIFGSASQTTTGFGGNAERANDGNTNGAYPAGSVTHSNGDEMGSWTVQLFGESTIDSIVVWNRTDCCSHRLINTKVSVLDAGGAELESHEITEDTTGVVNVPIVFAAPVPGAAAVRVQRTAADGEGANWLSLAEVEVFGDGPFPVDDPNLTQRCGVSVSQSTQLGGFAPELAIDGNLGNFTHTLGSDDAAQWEIDFGEVIDIGQVILYNRTSCCGSRLRDITVEVLAGDVVVYTSELLNAENALGAFPNGPPTLDVDIIEDTGGTVQGDKVRVSRAPDPDLSGSGGQGNADEGNVLSLGEVQIFAAPVLSQITGDCNQDGELNIADVLCGVGLLYPGFLLLSEPANLPCSGDLGNLAVLDTNGDLALGNADLAHLAMFLFGGGAAPNGGAGCRLIDKGSSGCDTNPGCL